MALKIPTVVIGTCDQYALGYCAFLSEDGDVQYPCSAILTDDCEVKIMLCDTEYAFRI